MYDHIYINHQRLIAIVKNGRKNFYHLNNGDLIVKSEIYLVESECPNCRTKKTLSKLHSFNLKKASMCFKCNSSGANNSFFGKRHSNKTKSIISFKNKGRLAGDKNPMYGKSLYDRWVEIYGEDKASYLKDQYSLKMSQSVLGEKNGFFGKKHSLESRNKMSSGLKKYFEGLTDEQWLHIKQVQSLAQKRLFNNNPEIYRAQRRRAGKIALLNHKKYHINKIESAVKEQLDNSEFIFKYSVIMGFFQYDFGCEDHRVLIEVQGDYWHGNPMIYNQLNHIQKGVNARDITKKEFAESHGFKVYYIWESDIKNNNFDIINEALNEIRNNTNRKN